MMSGSGAAEHRAHGDVHEHKSEAERRDDTVSLTPEGPCPGLGLLVAALCLFPGIHLPCSETRLLYLAYYLLRRYLALVILYLHAVHGEVHVAALHSVELARHSLHRGRAGRTVHSLYKICLAFHILRLPCAMLHSAAIIYPQGVFVKATLRLLAAVFEADHACGGYLLDFSYF